MDVFFSKLNFVLRTTEQGLNEKEKDIALALIADVCQIEHQRLNDITGEKVLVEGFDAARVTLP